MIMSPRLSLAKKSDDETPGVATPPEPTEPAPVEPAAPADAVAVAPAAKSRTGLLIGLIAGGAALVLIAVIAVIALVLPGILRGGSGDNAADVADIAGEPEDTWKFDWVGDADEQFLEDAPEIAAVGDRQALIWASFDSYAYSDTQGNSAGWYEGYDEQYVDGYDAGLEYEADYQAWFDDTSFTLELPRDEDYYPEGAYGNYDEWLGFDDGFWDARLGEDEGYSKKEKPVDPDYTPTITLLDTITGDAAWTVDLAEAIDGVDYTSSFYAFDIEGSNAVAVSTTTTDGDTTSYSVVALAKSDGEVISELESDGPTGVEAFDGDIIVTTSDEDGEDTSVARYAVDGLDDDPKWEEDGPDSSYGASVFALGTDFLEVIGDDEGVILSGSTGKEADFGDDVDFSVTYTYAGGQLIRSERSDDSTEIEGWNTDDDSTWDDSIEADYAQIVDGTIFTAEADGDRYTGLVAINPSNGEPLWAEAWDDEFDGVYGVRNGKVLVVSGTKLIVLDAGNGEALFSQKLGDVSGFYEGANAYYVSSDDELVAYGYSEKGDIWSFDVDDDQDVVAIGRSLGLVDHDKGTLHGLAAK